jgi:hypothetical protein
VIGICQKALHRPSIQVTSLFLHLYPACVCYATRWHPPPALAAALNASPATRARFEETSIRDLVLVPTAHYLAWAVLYYLKIFVVSSDRIQRRGYETLFKYVTDERRRSLYGAFVLRFPEKLRPMAFLAAHLVLTLAVLALGVLWWNSKVAGGAFLVAAFGVSAWNGERHSVQYRCLKHLEFSLFFFFLSVNGNARCVGWYSLFSTGQH